MAAACMTASVFAAGNQPTMSEKWNGDINVAKLSKYLKLSFDQYDEVSNICEYFGERMSQATSTRKNQDKRIREAVYGNLKLMKQALTPKQYAEYVRVLNITLQNKGISVEK